jgi:hypothetical protein
LVNLESGYLFFNPIKTVRSIELKCQPLAQSIEKTHKLSVRQIVAVFAGQKFLYPIEFAHLEKVDAIRKNRNLLGGEENYR